MAIDRRKCRKEATISREEMMAWTKKVVLLNSGSDAHCWEVNTPEMSVSKKGKFALFRRPGIWGEGGLMYQRTNFPPTNQSTRTYIYLFILTVPCHMEES